PTARRWQEAFRRIRPAPRRPGAAPRSPQARTPRARSGPGTAQPHVDLEAALGVVAGTDFAVHSLHERAHEGEADAGAARAAGELVLAAVKGLEQVRLVLPPDAGTVIAHADRHSARRGAAAQLDPPGLA